MFASDDTSDIICYVVFVDKRSACDETVERVDVELFICGERILESARAE